ncbi:MAG: phosphoribosylanthranilate isomerase [Alphaproteobacteria bacterium]|nr:phosphoribosylanthranilate isomerase [Alphaproteobacteria bacterium]
MPLIKNCGFKTTHTIDVAIESGASFIGLVSHPASPRHVDLRLMADLAAHIGERAEHVAVLVNPHDTLIDDIMAHYTPHYWQLHNVTSPARIIDIRKRTGAHIISAIAIHDADDLVGVDGIIRESDYVLFDTKQHGKDGGTGKSFNWDVLNGLVIGRPWFLAGGLNPENVADAIRTTKAPMVDVSTGIESAPGEKSIEKIAAFNKAVLSTRA